MHKLPVRRIFAFAALGAITGAVSAFAFLVEMPGVPNDIVEWINLLAPGATFGMVFSLLLAVGGWLSPLRALVWLAAAMVGYAIAELCVFVATYESLLRDQKTSALVLAGPIAGMLGGGFLAGTTRLLIRGARWWLPTITGAVMAAIPSGRGLFSQEMQLFVFFIVWQAGYAAALAFALPMAQFTQER